MSGLAILVLVVCAPFLLYIAFWGLIWLCAGGVLLVSYAGGANRALLGGLAIWLVAALVLGAAEAQEVWVLCESIIGGTTQAFPGSCPTGWVFVGFS